MDETTPQLRSAFARGAGARRRGVGKDDHPYRGQNCGYKKAFINAWSRGWWFADREITDKEAPDAD